MSAQQPSTRPIDRLLAVMAQLRDPDSGCPWDVEQTFATIAPYTIEEAYEVADAIERGDYGDLKDELGDLLLQVVFHARMAEESGHFDFDGIATAIAEKMIRRHPHVFGDERVDGAAAQTRAWEEQKAAERAARQAGSASAPAGVLDGLPLALPALLRAYKLQKRAARVGFDWPTAAPVHDKLHEELAELEHAADAGDAHAVAEEIGDLLFACANLSRHYGVDPEAALRAANAKFERRFRAMEDAAGENGEDLAAAGLERLEAMWQAAKARERRNP